MRQSFRPNVDLALIHYPVSNKKGDIVTSAVTNLDLHDIARAGRTFGVNAYYVVTPLHDQQILVDRIVSHWTTGEGGRLNPARREALQLIRIKDSLDDVVSEIQQRGNGAPKVVVTSAKSSDDGISFETLRRQMQDGIPYLLTFGTAWGLSDTVMKCADYTLDPICGGMDYNHLSVRSAVSIILDRLLS